MSRADRERPWLEYLLTVPILAGIGYTIWFFFTNHYLPQPFFYEPSGTWMDWYSLTRWAHIQGAYEVEQTIYPPLSFVLMKVFSIPHCYKLTISEEARACDWLGGVALMSGWLINVVVTFLTMRKIDRRTAVPRSFTLTFGLPMIYGLERGNLLIFCYTCVLLGYGPLLKSARLKWLFAGLAVNFKVYLVAGIVAPLLKRRWMATEGMLIATVLVYLATWFILGEGSPAQLLRNLTNYTSGFGASNPLDLWYPSTYIPVATLLNGSFPVTVVMSSTQADAVILGVTLFTRVVQALILAAAAAAWLRPEAVPHHRIVYLAIALALTSSEAGGYTQMILFPFVMMERRRGVARTGAIVLTYLLSIPYEVRLGLVPPIARYSWLANVDVIAEFGVGAMSLLRPGLTMTISALIASATLHDVWRDVRTQAWRGRRRFRRDWQFPTRRTG